jgi:hypothetical protein
MRLTEPAADGGGFGLDTSALSAVIGRARSWGRQHARCVVALELVPAIGEQLPKSIGIDDRPDLLPFQETLQGSSALFLQSRVAYIC